MAIRTLRVVTSLLSRKPSRYGARMRAEPVRIVLPPLPGIRPSPKPAVRIFIGTEAAQFRAERTLVWSIHKVRDPARRYEIYLMKDLAGFNRSLWLTGFTNYRFAIPHFAGHAGRAIWNDVDQVYLEDPAVLFDTDMGEHGVLSINDHDTSVMLIDCARMGAIWTLESARALIGHRRLEARMRQVNGLWGPLDGSWNARDTECLSGRARLVHYTTIHWQPWRPSPGDYVYQDNPAADLWHTLEQEADAAGFHVFDAHAPSPDFSSRPARGLSMAVPGCGPKRAFDRGVADALEHSPDADIPWLLDRFFGQAGRVLTVTLDLTAPHLCAPADPLWWYAQMAAAGRRQPGVAWQLAVRSHGFPGRDTIHRWSGGPPLREPPRTWVLLYQKTGHRSQAMGVADALGWPYETREISAYPLRYLFAIALCGLGLRDVLPGRIAAPWPDLVIGSGWLTAIVARWISRRSGGTTRLILLGRKAGSVGESQDIGVSCRHFRLPPHPRRIETVLPPNKVSGLRLQEGRERWPNLFGAQPRPHVVLLVGGSCAQYRLDPQTAHRMASRVRQFVAAAGGSLAVVTSPRTGRAAAAALRAGAGPDAIMEIWQPRNAQDNPYFGYLAAADSLIVTGESESMLAEAVATGKPVYIHPLPRRRHTPVQWLAQYVHHRCLRDRINARGSRRPQQGLQYLCARIVEHGLLVPPRDMETLHQGLIDIGVARFFGEPPGAWQPRPWRETEAVAEQIRVLLGLGPVHDLESRPMAHRATNA